MTHQVVQLRHGTTIDFLSHDDEQAYWEELERTRAAMTCQYQIAPRQGYIASGGKRLGAGDEVTLAMLEGGDEPAWRILRRLIQRGIVIENYGFTTGPEAA